jgi:hypothetical protein
LNLSGLPPPDAGPGCKLLELLDAAEEKEFILCFDQMENFFATGRADEQIAPFWSQIRDVVRSTPNKRVTFLICFREEAYLRVTKCIADYFKDSWGELIIWKMTAEEGRLSDRAKKGMFSSIEAWPKRW